MVEKDGWDRDSRCHQWFPRICTGGSEAYGGDLRVPVSTNPQTRESRLLRSVPEFLAVSAGTILRFYAMYRPLRLFLGLEGWMIAGGVLIGLRFLYYFITGPGTGRVQSLILAAILTILGFHVCLIGLMADLVRLNRKMLEEALCRVRQAVLNTKSGR